MHYFSYLFDKVLYMFRTDPLSIIRSNSTLYKGNRYLSCQFGVLYPRELELDLVEDRAVVL